MISEDELREKMATLESTLRAAGLYVDRFQVIMPGDAEDVDPTQHAAQTPGNAVVVVECYVGDVAFSKKIQEPEQADYDAEFRQMTRGLLSDTFEEERRRMLDALKPDPEEDK
jgi:hypothetical protein